jgi:hypothetical protein
MERRLFIQLAVAVEDWEEEEEEPISAAAAAE